MNAIAPLPSLVPENAPFSSEQRAWLNGFFSAYLGVAEAAAGENAEAAEPEYFPWHDATLAMPERMALAAQAKPERKLMAAMAQLDCGQCGYLCQTYAEAVWSGAEADMGRYNEELVKAGILIDADGLHPSSKGARVHFSGDKRTVTDGPFIETKELVAGYWIWEVKDMDEAVAWVKRCPNPMPGDSEIEISHTFLVH